MKIIISVLALAIALLGYRVFALEAELKQLQTNAAIAILSAEAANNKVGAIAPYFEQDKQAFARAWLDSINLPPAVFPDDVWIPLKSRLEEARTSKEAERQKASTFK